METLFSPLALLVKLGFYYSAHAHVFLSFIPAVVEGELGFPFVMTIGGVGQMIYVVVVFHFKFCLASKELLGPDSAEVYSTSTSGEVKYLHHTLYGLKYNYY